MILKSNVYTNFSGTHPVKNEPFSVRLENGSIVLEDEVLARFIQREFGSSAITLEEVAENPTVPTVLTTPTEVGVTGLQTFKPQVPTALDINNELINRQLRLNSLASNVGAGDEDMDTLGKLVDENPDKTDDEILAMLAWGKEPHVPKDGLFAHLNRDELVNLAKELEIEIKDDATDDALRKIIENGVPELTGLEESKTPEGNIPAPTKAMEGMPGAKPAAKKSGSKSAKGQGKTPSAKKKTPRKA